MTPASYSVNLLIGISKSPVRAQASEVQIIFYPFKANMEQQYLLMKYEVCCFQCITNIPFLLRESFRITQSKISSLVESPPRCAWIARSYPEAPPFILYFTELQKQFRTHVVAGFVSLLTRKHTEHSIHCSAKTVLPRTWVEKMLRSCK